MDWLEANVLSKSQQQLGPGSPRAGRRSWGARAAQAQLTPSAQHEAAGQEDVGIPDEPQIPQPGPEGARHVTAAESQKRIQLELPKEAPQRRLD